VLQGTSAQVADTGLLRWLGFQVVDGAAGVVAAHATAYHAGLQHLLGDIDQHHRSQFQALGGEEVFQSLGLLQGPGVAVEQHVRGLVQQPREDKAVDGVVVHQFSLGHDGFRPQADLRPFRDGISQNVTG
jgi:hypothetical protein